MALVIGSGDIIWLMDLMGCPKPSFHFSSKASDSLQLKPWFGHPGPHPCFSCNIGIMTLNGDDKASVTRLEAARAGSMISGGSEAVSSQCFITNWSPGRTWTHRDKELLLFIQACLAGLNTSLL